MTRAALIRLTRLLEQERRALTAGDLSRLARLAPRKAMLIEHIESAARESVPPEAEALMQTVRSLAHRNARLFDAALSGITDARALLTRAREGGRGQTYGRDGARAALEPQAGSLHRRA
jgi:flagellar biosynthesis/type III secretory pathway chaperone